MRFFGAYTAWFLVRRFDAVRVLRGRGLARAEGSSLVVYANHPSWWDALIFVAVARLMAAERRAFAPMAAHMLERHRVFRRIGAFPVELDRPAGARAFLEVSRRLLSCPDTLLFVTPTGRFMDVRTRPLGFRPGLARLAVAAPEARFVPLAIEYPFWEEPRPEALVAFGEPIAGEEIATAPGEVRTGRLEGALVRVMDLLAHHAQRREPADFDVVLGGRRPRQTVAP